MAGNEPACPGHDAYSVGGTAWVATDLSRGVVQGHFGLFLQKVKTRVALRQGINCSLFQKNNDIKANRIRSNEKLPKNLFGHFAADSYV
jgi:hypothetical protein